MDKEKKLEGIASTYLIKCRGNDKKDKLVLPFWRKEKVIVKVYKDGQTIPVCRYISGDHDHQCSAPSRVTNYGYCKYRSY